MLNLVQLVSTRTRAVITAAAAVAAVAAAATRYYSVEELAGQRVIVVCNLPKARLAGADSFGMVLCAANADRTTVEFVAPPPGVEPGAAVVFGDLVAEVLSNSQMKKRKVSISISLSHYCPPTHFNNNPFRFLSLSPVPRPPPYPPRPPFPPEGETAPKKSSPKLVAVVLCHYVAVCTPRPGRNYAAPRCRAVVA